MVFARNLQNLIFVVPFLGERNIFRLKKYPPDLQLFAVSSGGRFSDCLFAK